MTEAERDRRIEALAAERVLGWQNAKAREYTYAGPLRPLTSIADAFALLEAVWENQIPNIQISRVDPDGCWICELATDPQGDWRTHTKDAGMSLPRAITYAALRAVGASVELEALLTESSNG